MLIATKEIEGQSVKVAAVSSQDNNINQDKMERISTYIFHKLPTLSMTTIPLTVRRDAEIKSAKFYDRYYKKK